jgi:hypothetical protein
MTTIWLAAGFDSQLNEHGCGRKLGSLTCKRLHLRRRCGFLSDGAFYTKIEVDRGLWVAYAFYD